MINYTLFRKIAYNCNKEVMNSWQKCDIQGWVKWNYTNWSNT